METKSDMLKLYDDIYNNSKKTVTDIEDVQNADNDDDHYGETDMMRIYCKNISNIDTLRCF